ncbi:MAG: multiheme c-type cytochrome [Brevundimonas sp.]
MALPGRAAATAPGVHQGVASCAGSTCHGRQAATGAVVRQNELVSWQDPSGPGGSHSRAWRTLTYARAQAITRRLGLGPAQAAPACLGCHAEPAAAGARGARFQVSDGVGCESCHGASGGWIASHYTVDVSHAANVARGMTPLENPVVRANVCLDCHWGSDKPNQFVTHAMMSAGHPRLSFELELFTAFQQHHDLDADYAQRKATVDSARMWAIGQAQALKRILTVYGDSERSRGGVFPELYFFDCHSCHRPISDEPGAPLLAETNPGRPIPPGTPPFNDENMIMLAAAARRAPAALGERFQADSRSFHRAIAGDRAGAIEAARRLANTADQLSTAFASSPFSRADTLAILEDVLGEALAPRYTDYAGGAQAVMATDTLLNALVAQGQMDGGTVRAMRPDIDRAYAAVRDPNRYRPQEFRRAMGAIAGAVRRAR